MINNVSNLESNYSNTDNNNESEIKNTSIKRSKTTNNKLSRHNKMQR